MLTLYNFWARIKIVVVVVVVGSIRLFTSKLEAYKSRLWLFSHGFLINSVSRRRKWIDTYEHRTDFVAIGLIYNSKKYNYFLYLLFSSKLECLFQAESKENGTWKKCWQETEKKKHS